jgi:TPR repeat protein
MKLRNWTSAGVAAVLMLALVGGVNAGALEDGYAAAERGDYATAYRLWRPLAEQGDAEAQYKLGTMYDIGHGVPQDYVEAHKWYSLAAAAGEPSATFFRDDTAKSMTPAQIAEAQRLAREWQAKKQK